MARYKDLDWEIDRDLGRISEDEALGISKPLLGRLWRWLRAGWLGTSFFWLLRTTWKFAWFPIIFSFPLARRIANIGPDEPAPLYLRAIDGILTRIVVAPIILFLFFGLVVWQTTHPAPAQAMQTPAQYNVYYQQVTLTTTDRQTIDLWYLPPLNVEDIVVNSDEALSRDRPGVVLCHALGRTHDQYLPLALKLNHEGYAVVLLNTRGQTTAGGGAVTFGLREGLDVLTAVDFLRSHAIVDSKRIAVVGSGVGGAAVLHAAALDQSIAAVCADDVWPNLQSFVKRGLRQRYVPSSLLSGLYVMTFETLLRERSADGDLTQTMPRITQPALLLARTQPGAAPAEDVLRLSALTKGPHRAVVIDSAANASTGSITSVDDQITKFLDQALRWTPPRVRSSRKVQNLLDAQVR